MKEFKLKTWYPGLPKDWIGKEVYVVERDYFYEVHPSLKDLIEYKKLPKDEVEDNISSFWTSVTFEPKQYNLLEIKFLQHGTLLERTNNGLFIHNPETHGEGVYHEDVLLSQDVNILERTYPDEDWREEKSTKYDYVPFKLSRLSDGEVFKLGDGVYIPLENRFRSYVIKSFKRNRVELEGYGFCNLSDIAHFTPSEEVLFYSTDDEPMRVGSRYYWVGNDNYRNNEFVSKWELQGVKCKDCIIRNKNFTTDVGVKIFHNKQKAIEYITENKPCLSLKDIRELSSPYKTFFRIRIQKLEELIKSRIN